MRGIAMDLETWACPGCFSRLEPEGSGLRCTSEGHGFPVRDGLPVLLRPEDEGLLREADAYVAAWKHDTLAPPKGSALDLPFV